MSLKWIATVVAAVVVAGCGSRAANENRPSPSNPAPRNNRVFTLEDIMAAQQQNIYNAFDLVNRYHPEWLRPSGQARQGQTTQVSVWQDRQRMGGPTALRQIPLSLAVEIRYMSPSEAQAELGLDNLGGAIVVRTR